MKLSKIMRFFCIHNYSITHHVAEGQVYECSKCGKEKKSWINNLGRKLSHIDAVHTVVMRPTTSKKAVKNLANAFCKLGNEVENVSKVLTKFKQSVNETK